MELFDCTPRLREFRLQDELRGGGRYKPSVNPRTSSLAALATTLTLRGSTARPRGWENAYEFLDTGWSFAKRMVAVATTDAIISFVDTSVVNPWRAVCREW